MTRPLYSVDASDVTRGIAVANMTYGHACRLVDLARVIRDAARRGSGDKALYRAFPRTGNLAHINGRPC